MRINRRKWPRDFFSQFPLKKPSGNRKQKAVKTVATGQHVIFVDEYGTPRAALVTETWGNKPKVGDKVQEFSEYDTELYPNPPAINLLFISGDERRRDDCGRQPERRTSVAHRSMMSAPGNYWTEA
jgi:hypothetical protein